MLLFKMLILCYLININNTWDIPVRIKNKYESYKKKILGLWKGQRGKELHLDINELEYPRGNETLRRIHEKLWHEYYECLKKRYNSIGTLKTLHPFALAALEGASVTLKCNICISPNDVHTIESVNWYYRNTRDISAKNTEVDITGNVIISSDDCSLILYDIKKYQEGLYWCKMSDSISTPYYLHIADDNEPTVIVRPQTAPNASHPQPPIFARKYGLKVFSSWSTWSSCSICDKVGVRIRYGHCMFSKMSFMENSERSENEDKLSPTTESETSLSSPSTKNEDNDYFPEPMIENVAETPESNENSFEIELITKLENVLTVFQNIMPCRSWFTPKEIQDIPEIKNRKTEIMKQFCKVKCQRDVIFQIRDKMGRVLESANNSAGIFSTIQGIPEPRPSVQRVTIYRKLGKRTKLKCPGNLNTDLPIIWKINRKELNPDLIKAQSNGRIYMDSRQRIVIKKIQTADVNIYSCWQRSLLAGTIRLEVSYGDIPKLNYRIMMLGGIPILSVFLYVFWRAWRGRHRYTKH